MTPRPAEHRPALHPAGLALCCAALLALAAPADARRSDRNQPMNIDAARAELATDASRPSLLRGGVIITQGTLNIRSNEADVYQARDGGVSRVVLRGGPATLRQQLDDGTMMNVRASQIDYNHVSEVAVFTGNVHVEQPRGSLSGERVTYNMATGTVQSGGEGSGRVRMTIQPRTTQGGN